MSIFVKTSPIYLPFGPISYSEESIVWFYIPLMTTCRYGFVLEEVVIY